MTYINGIKGGLVANVGMYESPQFTTDDLLKIVASKDIGAGEELLVDYGSEFVLGYSVTNLIKAAAVIEAAGDAANTSADEGSAHVPEQIGAAKGTSGAGGGPSEDAAEGTLGDGPSAPAAEHGSAGTSGDGASASTVASDEHVAEASQTQSSTDGTMHCSVTSTGFLTLISIW